MLTLISLVQITLEKLQILKSGFNSNRNIKVEDGSLVRQPYIKYDKAKPYLIGLTGGLASGKSTVRKELEKLSLATIDCDKLGHRAYEKNTNAYKKIIETFGDEILDDENKSIDRKKLGQKVFQQPNELKKLTEIVWPEIKKLLEEEIDILFKQDNHKVIIIEAALLIEAEWHTNMNEIWVCIVTEDKAIERAVQRDKSNVERVKSQLKNQMNNQERIQYANVLINTSYQMTSTLEQVNLAYQLLKQRLL